jgi:4-hydroxy 2-oxovalerate aldolase
LDHVAILDCTLRDGGYYTAWDFSDELVGRYLETISRLPVEVVELGYCNTPKSRYLGRFQFLTSRTTRWARSILNPDQQLAVMIDEKSVTTVDASSLLTGHRGIVDLVRIAVAPGRLASALRLADEVRNLGFEVGLNIMQLSTYWDRVESLDEVSALGEVARVVSLVDSYGGCTPDQVAVAVAVAIEAIPNATIGFHGHDNLELAFANSLSAAAVGAGILDGTLAGMGRGPGNTKSELLLVHRSSGRLGELDHIALDQAVHAFDGLRAEHGWGTNLPYMISGVSGLPQGEVMEWLGKNRYTVPAIIQALQGEAIDDFDHEDFADLASSVAFRPEVLIIGGGPSVDEHADAIIAYARASEAVVIHANYRHLGLIPRFDGEQYLCVAGDAVARLPSSETLEKIKAVIVPAAPRFHGTVPSDRPVRQAAPFVIEENPAQQLGPVSDIGPLALGLGAAIAVSAEKVTLVGFDGYRNADAGQQELARETQEMVDGFRNRWPEATLTSATRTMYSIPTQSVYSRLMSLGWSA